MNWLTPDKPWAAHPMWFCQNPEDPDAPDFLEKYSAALDVRIVEGNPRCWNNFPQEAETCPEHLLLDPDTGLSQPRNGRRSRKHVTLSQFTQIARSPNRQGKLTLIYDQSYFAKATTSGYKPKRNYGHCAAQVFTQQPTWPTRERRSDSSGHPQTTRPSPTPPGECRKCHSSQYGASLTTDADTCRTTRDPRIHPAVQVEQPRITETPN